MRRKNKLHPQPANCFSISSINVRQLPKDFPLKMDANLKKKEETFCLPGALRAAARLPKQFS